MAAAFDEYISDPAKPVPYRARPEPAVGYTGRFDLGIVVGGRSTRAIGKD